MLSSTSNDMYKARLLAASSPHTGDWLHAPPIASVCLLLSDEAVRVAWHIDWGAKPVYHTTVCMVKTVSARGLHGLACRRSGPRHQRHSQLNDILWRAFKKAPVPAVKEPPGLSRDDGKRPDGSRCCHGQKANRWHGMSQYQTPMPTHTSLTRRPRLGRQLARPLVTRKPNTGSWPTATSSFQLP